MAQVLKPETEAKMLSAARKEWLEVGFGAVTMAAVARRAGVAVGNLYRYFADREALLVQAVPRTVIDRALVEIDAALTTPAFPNTTTPTLVGLTVEHRDAMRILLERAEGSPMERESLRLRRRLVSGVSERFPHLERPLIEAIYRAYLTGIAGLLEKGGPRLAARLTELSRYHLAGLAALDQAAQEAAS